jgi:hypothetical protein
MLKESAFWVFAGEEMVTNVLNVFRFGSNPVTKFSKDKPDPSGLSFTNWYLIGKQVMVLLLILFAGCSKNRNCEVIHQLIEFEIIKSIDIPLAGAQYSHITPNLYENDTTFLLLGLDPFSNKIDLYDLVEKKFISSIQLHHEGPNQVLSPRAMYVHTLDSIFLLNDINQLYLVNRRGERVSFWDFDFALPDSIFSLDESLTGEFIIAAYGKSEYLNLPFFYDYKSKALIARILILNDLDGSAEYSVIYKTPNLVSIDLVRGELKQLLGRYPDNFLIEPKPHNPFAHFTRLEEATWVQFDASPEIYWVEKDTFICAPSMFARNQITRFKADQEVDENIELRSYHTDEANVGIYYDPFNQFVYRVFQHGQPHKNAAGRLNQKLQAKFSVVMMRTTGEIIGEAVFESERYNFLDVFVTRNGILISKENPFNKQNVEEVYSFDLIRFKI